VQARASASTRQCQHAPSWERASVSTSASRNRARLFQQENASPTPRRWGCNSLTGHYATLDTGDGAHLAAVAKSRRRTRSRAWRPPRPWRCKSSQPHSTRVLVLSERDAVARSRRAHPPSRIRQPSWCSRRIARS